MIYTPEFAPYQPKRACFACAAEVEKFGVRQQLLSERSFYTPKRAA